MRSPIEAMIDAACGFRPGELDRLRAEAEANRVTLRCPACSASKRVERHFTDPLDAAIVETPCPKCGPIERLRYFDAAGNEIIVQYGAEVDL